MFVYLANNDRLMSFFGPAILNIKNKLFNIPQTVPERPNAGLMVFFLKLINI